MTMRKKILFFITRLGMGGTEKAIVRISNALSECSSCEVTVMALFGGGILENDISDKVCVKHIFPCFIRGVSTILKYLPSGLLYRMLIRCKYDIEICAEDTNPSRHIMSGSKICDKLCWVHLNISGSDRAKSSIYHQEMSSFKRIICVSNIVKKSFKKAVGLKNKLTVAYTPIDTLEVSTNETYNSNSIDNHYVAVGRLEHVKGFDRLIDAVAKLNNSEFRLEIYGDGTQRNYLQRKIISYGLQNQIQLMGMVTNPYPHIVNSKGLICPSRSESFGFSIIEAMLLRIPVLSTSNGGADEILTSSSYGLLCENSTEGLVQGLKELICSRNKIDVEKAYKRACDFSTDKCLERLKEILFI